MAKRKNDDPPKFEEALRELGNIARELDEGALSLDDSLRRFEQAMGLLRHCYAALDAAEKRIAMLTGFDSDGNPVLEPFDASATLEHGAAGRRKSRPETPAQPECDELTDFSAGERGLF